MLNKTEVPEIRFTMAYLHTRELTLVKWGLHSAPNCAKTLLTTDFFLLHVTATWLP